MVSNLPDEKKALDDGRTSISPTRQSWPRLAVLMIAAGVSFALFGLALLLLSQLSSGFRLAFKGLGGGDEFIVAGNMFINVGFLWLFIRWLLRPVYIR